VRECISFKREQEQEKWLSDARIQRLRSLVDAHESGLDEPLGEVERAGLSLAIARTPLFMTRYIALMDTKETAARPIAETLPDIEWALGILDDLTHWQQRFASISQPPRQRAH